MGEGGKEPEIVLFSRQCVLGTVLLLVLGGTMSFMDVEETAIENETEEVDPTVLADLRKENAQLHLQLLRLQKDVLKCTKRHKMLAHRKREFRLDSTRALSPTDFPTSSPTFAKVRLPTPAPPLPTVEPTPAPPAPAAAPIPAPPAPAAAPIPAPPAPTAAPTPATPAPTAAPAKAKAARKYSSGKKNIAIVGNGPISAADRKLIGAADEVWRFNDMKNMKDGEKLTTWVAREVGGAPWDVWGTNIMLRATPSYKYIYKRPVDSIAIVGMVKKTATDAQKGNPDMKIIWVPVYEGQVAAREKSEGKKEAFPDRSMTFGGCVDFKHSISACGPSTGTLIIDYVLSKVLTGESKEDGVYKGAHVHVFGMNWGGSTHNWGGECHDMARESDAVYKCCVPERQCTVHKPYMDSYLPNKKLILENEMQELPRFQTTGRILQEFALDRFYDNHLVLGCVDEHKAYLRGIAKGRYPGPRSHPWHKIGDLPKEFAATPLGDNGRIVLKRAAQLMPAAFATETAAAAAAAATKKGGGWASDMVINEAREILFFSTDSTAVEKDESVKPPPGHDLDLKFDLEWPVQACPYKASANPQRIAANLRTLERMAPTALGFVEADMVPTKEPQHFGSTASSFSMSFRLGKVTAPIDFLLSSNAEIVWDQYTQLQLDPTSKVAKMFPRGHAGVRFSSRAGAGGGCKVRHGFLAKQWTEDKAMCDAWKGPALKEGDVVKVNWSQKKGEANQLYVTVWFAGKKYLDNVHMKKWNDSEDGSCLLVLLNGQGDSLKIFFDEKEALAEARYKEQPH